MSWFEKWDEVVLDPGSRINALLNCFYAPTEINTNNNYNQKENIMLQPGTKVMICSSSDYRGRFVGAIGTIKQLCLKENKYGVEITGFHNPNSKTGVFWFSQRAVTPYHKPIPILDESIKRVIFSGNKTIILWSDGAKTIATCGDEDHFDHYAGFCAAITKYVFGSTSKAKKIMMKSSPEIHIIG